MRLGELVNSGLIHPNATTISQKTRNIPIEMLPSSQLSFLFQNELVGPAFRSLPTACDGELVSMVPLTPPPSACRFWLLLPLSIARCVAQAPRRQARA